MKTLKLVFVLGFILACELYAQQSMKICFETSAQACLQTRRLNHYYNGLEKDTVSGGMCLTFKHYYLCDSVYCVDICIEDIDRTYGVFNRRMIKKRHIKKGYVRNPENIGFGQTTWSVGYKKRR